MDEATKIRFDRGIEKLRVVPPPTTRIGTLKTYVECGKLISGQFENALKNYCFMNSVELKLQIDKGFFTNTIRIVAEGKEQDIIHIKEWMESLGA